MRKKGMMAACIVALCLVLAQGVFAGEAGKIGAGLRISGISIADDKITDPAGTRYTLSYDQTADYGINGTYFFLPDFALELDAEYAKVGVDSAYPSDPKLVVGDVTQVPVLLTFRFQPTIAERWMPYAGVGLGYYFNSVDSKDPSLNLDLENCMGYHLNTGIEMMIREASAVSLDLKYRWSRAELKETRSGWSENVDLNAWTFGIGYKYYF